MENLDLRLAAVMLLPSVAVIIAGFIGAAPGVSLPTPMPPTLSS